MMSALFHAADRGVEIQIIVDGINGMMFLNGSRNFRQLAAHENVQVKLYNPINLLALWKINYRMHDKYLIADDFAYILGGRCTDYLNQKKKIQETGVHTYECLAGQALHTKTILIGDRISIVGSCKLDM